RALLELGFECPERLSLSRSRLRASGRLSRDYSAGLCRIRQLVSRGGIVGPQSDHSCSSDPHLGGDESISADRAAENQRYLLFEIALPDRNSCLTRYSSHLRYADLESGANRRSHSNLRCDPGFVCDSGCIKPPSTAHGNQ